MASYLYTRCNCNTSHRRASLYNSSPTSSFRLFPVRANRLLRKNLRVHFSTTLRLIQSRNFRPIRVIARVDLLFFFLPLLLLSVSFVPQPQPFIFNRPSFLSLFKYRFANCPTFDLSNRKRIVKTGSLSLSLSFFRRALCSAPVF